MEDLEKGDVVRHDSVPYPMNVSVVGPDLKKEVPEGWVKCVWWDKKQFCYAINNFKKEELLFVKRF